MFSETVADASKETYAGNKDVLGNYASETFASVLFLLFTFSIRTFQRLLHIRKVHFVKIACNYCCLLTSFELFVALNTCRCSYHFVVKFLCRIDYSESAAHNW